jgi:four helix bundle protein
MAFLFRDLDVYKEGCRFVGDAERLAVRFSARSLTLADQLRRASEKIPAQIGEGYGRWHVKDKIQFYRFALGSVNECVGHLDSAVAKGLLTEAEATEYVDRLDRIGRMMQSLIQSVLARHTRNQGPLS